MLPEPAGPRTVNLGPLDRIPPGEGRAFKVGPLPVAVYRTRAGRLFATQAICPHRAGPLADGTLGGTTIICPLHAFRFDLTSGEPLGNPCYPLRTYPVELSPEGEILLTLG